MSPLDAPRDPRNSDLEAALIEAREAYSNTRPKSAAIHAKAREVMPGGNTRTVLFYTPFPTAMVRGEGRAYGMPMGANTWTCAANTPPGCSAIPSIASSMP